jgi:hypothetical protein
MRPDNATIVLAGETYTIKPLTLKQLRKILPITDEVNKLVASGSFGAAQSLDKSADVVKIALERDYAEVAANLDNLEIDYQDISIAFKTILIQGGLAEAAPGETVAAS